MADIEIVEKSNTQLLNTHIKFEQFILSGQTDPSIQGYYPLVDFQEDYLSILLKDLQDFTRRPIDDNLGDSSLQMSIQQDELPSYFEDNLKLLEDAFIKEFLLKENEFKACKSLLTDTFNSISKFIAELNFEAGTVEINNQKSIKFTLVFPEKKLLMITKYLSPKDFDFDPNEVIFSLFFNRKLIATDVSEISQLAKGFKECFAM
jgi:hypothetical protein